MFVFNECTHRVIKEDPPSRDHRGHGRGDPPSDDYEELHRIGDRKVPSLTKSIVDGLNRFREKVSRRKIQEYIEDERWNDIQGLVQWDEFDDVFTDFNESIGGLVIKGGQDLVRRAKKGVKKQDEEIPVVFEITFDIENPGVTNWIESNGSKLITEVSGETRQAVSKMISDMMTNRETPSRRAKMIYDAVGLTKRQANAVSKFRQNLIEMGLPENRIDKMTEQRRMKSLRYRAEMISRTESIRGLNQGQIQAWGQAADKGLVDRTVAVKKWIVTKDDRLCPTCRMIPKEKRDKVKLDEEFTIIHYRELADGSLIETGQSTVPGPPAHPNCRCAVTLLTKGDRR